MEQREPSTWAAAAAAAAAVWTTCCSQTRYIQQLSVSLVHCNQQTSSIQHTTHLSVTTPANYIITTVNHIIINIINSHQTQTGVHQSTWKPLLTLLHFNCSLSCVQRIYHPCTSNTKFCSKFWRFEWLIGFRWHWSYPDVRNSPWETFKHHCKPLLQLSIFV